MAIELIAPGRSRPQAVQAVGSEPGDEPVCRAAGFSTQRGAGSRGVVLAQTAGTHWLSLADDALGLRRPD
jgi:hypothetical protein